MRTMPLVISPWSNNALLKSFYEGPSRFEWPFRAICHPTRHNERNFAMVVAGGGRAAGCVDGKTHAVGRCRRHRPMRHSMATRTTMTGTRYTRTRPWCATAALAARARVAAAADDRVDKRGGRRRRRVGGPHGALVAAVTAIDRCSTRRRRGPRRQHALDRRTRARPYARRRLRRRHPRRLSRRTRSAARVE
jgi:hypothetical protein